MRRLAIERLTTRGFRNLAAGEISLGPRFNVIHGDNGQGKTNLLEAAYVVATSKSFRTSKPGDVVAHDESACSVRAILREDDLAREQVVGLQKGARRVMVDGKRPKTLAEYAVLSPVVVFHPGSLALSTGAWSERRRLLDRLSLYRDPGSRAAGDAYGEALRARQRILETRGEGSRDLEPWEDLVVRHGRAVTRAREDVVAALTPLVQEGFAQVGAPGLSVGLAYRQGAPETDEGFRATLVSQRARDRARGSASSGPHRDDLILELGGKPVRGIASQGQHRAVVLALELAEIALVGMARGVQPILLLDDVSSELDRSRTVALMSALRAQLGQVLLTTTRPELIETLDDGTASSRRDFRVEGGLVRPG